MTCHIHHAHIFASDLDETIRFYREIFDARVVLDADLAGARNVFIAVGTGRLHLYTQAPKRPGRGSIHHIGIETDDIAAVVDRLEAWGIPLRKGITDLGVWKYVMVPAPDEVLLEVFQVDKEALPEELSDFFHG